MQGTPRQNIAAVFICLMVFAGVGLHLWANSASRNLQGPRYVAAGADGVVVALDRQLHQLSLNGTSRSVVSLDALGIEGTLVGLQLLSDGSLLLGEREERRVLRCHLERRHCEPLAPSDRFAIKGQFKFHLDEAGNRLYLTDTHRHRLLVQDLSQGALTELSTPNRLKYPNGITLDAHGRLLVADTNHHRIAVFEAASGESLEEKVMLKRDGRHWPTVVKAGAGGELWVLNADSGLGSADLMRVGTDGVWSRMALPPGADPLSLAVVENRVLVADPTQVRLYGVDTDTGAHTDFGDMAFQALLTERANGKQALERIGHIGLALLGGGIVLTLLLVGVVVRTSEPQVRQSETVLVRPAGHFPGVVWAPQDRDTATKVRRLLWTLMLLVMLPILGMGAMVFFPEEAAMGDLWLALAFGFLAVVLPGVAWMLRQQLRAGIGTDGEYLYLDPGNGRITRVAPEAVLHTPRLVTFGRGSVLLQLGTLGTAFEPQAYYRDIHPLVCRGRKVSELHLMVYQILNRQPVGLFSLAVIVIGLPAMVFYGLGGIH